MPCQPALGRRSPQCWPSDASSPPERSKQDRAKSRRLRLLPSGSLSRPAMEHRRSGERGFDPFGQPEGFACRREPDRTV